MLSIASDDVSDFCSSQHAFVRYLQMFRLTWGLFQWQGIISRQPASLPAAGGNWWSSLSGAASKLSATAHFSLRVCSPFLCQSDLCRSPCWTCSEGGRAGQWLADVWVGPVVIPLETIAAPPTNSACICENGTVGCCEEAQ